MGLAGVLIVMCAVVVGGCGAWGLLAWLVGRSRARQVALDFPPASDAGWPDSSPELGRTVPDQQGPGRRLPHRDPQRVVRQAAQARFTDASLEGFPGQALEALMAGPGALGAQRLHTGWALATHGRDALWLECHLGLPPEVACLLADAARNRGTRTRA